MKIITAYFYRHDNYAKLLNVFMRSAARTMPGVKVEVVETSVPMQKYTGEQKFDHHMDTYFGFMAKTERALYEDGPVCIADNDIIFFQSVEDVFNKDFDIAVTTRDHKCNLNTGVFFSRGTTAAKAFITRWLEHTRAIATQFDEDRISRHAGIDQAALFQTLEDGLPVKVLFLPCLIWNAEQTCWKHMTTKTRVVHIKSGLRDIVFGKKKMNRKLYYLKPILEEIQKYENHTRRNKVHRPSTVRLARPHHRFYQRH